MVAKSQLTVGMLSSKLRISKNTVHRIFKDDIHMSKAVQRECQSCCPMKHDSIRRQRWCRQIVHHAPGSNKYPSEYCHNVILFKRFLVKFVHL